MKILIAPNAFKGTLSPVAAARAIKRALGRIVPGAELALKPLSDGGDGLLDALTFGGRARTRTLVVPGPVLKPVRARWLLYGDAAVIEMAEASGLKYLQKSGLRPLDASTFGVGRLLRAAVVSGARSFHVGLGGSASNDGGAGCAAGFGFKLLDKNGRAVRPGPRGLIDLVKILPPGGGRVPAGTAITALTDVNNPLCGPRGSARVYGPQKGAGPDEVRLIEKALKHYSRIVKRDLGRDIGSLKGGAAAGGLGAGLYAFFGARLTGGADFVFEKLDVPAAVKAADLIVTGEGCFDEQSFSGKAPWEMARIARRCGKPVLLVCGSCRVKDRRRLAVGGVRYVAALDEIYGSRGRPEHPAEALVRGLILSAPGIMRALMR